MIYYEEVIFLIFLTHFYSRFYSFTFPITSLISLAFFFLFISLTFIIVLFSLPCHSCYSVISLFCSDLFPLSKVTLLFLLFIPVIYKLDLFYQRFYLLFFPHLIFASHNCFPSIIGHRVGPCTPDLVSYAWVFNT